MKNKNTTLLEHSQNPIEMVETDTKSMLLTHLYMTAANTLIHDRC